VYARSRPFLAREDGDSACVHMDSNTNKVTVTLEDEGAMDRVLAGGAAEARSTAKDFQYDGVFDPEADQKSVYEAVGKPVLRDVLQGYNGSILAYGQTGSGKTHSLLNTGGRDGSAPKEAGLLPRVVAALFINISSDVKSVYGVEVAMFQIYNDTIDDLLVEGHAQGKGANLLCQKGGNVLGLTWTQCKSPDELLKAFAKGRNNIVYAETKMNKASSRSHAVFQIKVSKRDRAIDKSQTGTKMRMTMGKLTIVDLAGSERIKKSGVQGQQLKEAVNINGSLLAFGNVVSALAEKKKFIPYRDSKLTQILEDSMGGNSKTSLLVCMSPSQESSNETLSTLEFASRAMKVEVDASINEGTVTVDAGRLAADLAGEGINEELKQQHKMMQQLEKSMKEKAAKDKAVAEKATKELDEKKKEAEKAVRESSALVNKWKEAADAATKKEKEAATKAAKALEQRDAEMSKKVKELEAKVAEAAEAKEIKAKLSAKDGEVLALKEQLRQTKDELAAVRQAMTKDADERVAAAAATHNDEFAALRRERDHAVEEHATAEREKKDAETKVAELAAEVATWKQRVEAVAASAATDTKTKLDAAAKRAKSELDAAVEAAEKRGAEAANVQAAKVLETRASVWAREKSDVVKAHEAEVATWKQRVEAVAVSAATDTKTKLDAAAKRAKSELDAAVAAAEKRGVETANVQAAKVLETRASAWAKEKSDVVKTYEAEVATWKQRIEDVKSEAASELKAKLDAAAKRTKAEIEAAETAAKEAQDKLVAEEGKRQRLQSVAFAAARCALAMRATSAQEDLEALKLRFETREPRKEDVAAMKTMSTTLQQKEMAAKKLALEKKQMEMEMENRDMNDAIFSGAGGRGVGGAGRRPMSAHIAALQAKAAARASQRAAAPAPAFAAARAPSAPSKRTMLPRVPTTTTVGL